MKTADSEMMAIAHRGWVAMGWALALVLCAGAAQAAGDPADKCEAAKNAAAGGYVSCLAKAQAKLVGSGGVDTDKYNAAVTKCGEKLGKKWASAEEKAAGACPIIGDLTTIDDFLSHCLGDTQAALAGGGLPLAYEECNLELAQCDAALAACDGALTACQTVSCGDGIAGGGETCDGDDLNGQTCATQAPSTPYGTLACAAGCGGFDTSGCVGRYDDSGDTIVDRATGLEWEKKNSIDNVQNLSNPHDGDNRYTWTSGAPGYPPNGSAFTSFLNQLNGSDGSACYGGHCDWRLPTLDELQTTAIPYYCDTMQCVVDPVFLPVKTDDYYWSGTTISGSPVGAWYLLYFQGATGTVNKLLPLYVRAVRTR